MHSLYGRAGAILAEMQELSKAEELLRQSVRLLEVRRAPVSAPSHTTAPHTHLHLTRVCTSPSLST